MNYLQMITEPVRRACKRYGYLPSVLIAQSCLENGFGKEESLVEHNNMVGLKADLLNSTWQSVWPGKSFSKETPEVYDGVPTTITDAFRIYDSVEQSFADYLCFMSSPKYHDVLTIKDPETLIKTVSSRGYATDPQYAKSVMRILNQYNLTQYDDLTGVEPTEYFPMNSPLVSYTKLSPCNSGKRTKGICRITPHCIVGQLDVQTIGACFDHESAKASCNYGIGKDGRVMLCVPEDCRSWCSSSADNDQRAVTIECASDKTAPYAFNDAVYAKLIDLCVDICQRNKKTKLIWIDDRTEALSKELDSDEMLLTVHRWFANKECPGDWMYSRMGDLAKAVTNRLKGFTGYRVYVLNTTKKALQEKGFVSIKKDNVLQCGVFNKKLNAKTLKKRLKAAGFDAHVERI